jgi:hypothetical protein
MGRRLKNSKAVRLIRITVGSHVATFELHREMLVDRKSPIHRVEELRHSAVYYLAHPEGSQGNDFQTTNESVPANDLSTFSAATDGYGLSLDHFAGEDLSYGSLVLPEFGIEDYSEIYS